MRQISKLQLIPSPISTILLIVLILAICQPLASQEIPDSSPLIGRNEPKYHPDGFLGQIAARARYLYATTSRDENQAVTDWQRYNFKANWVALDKLTIIVVSETEKQDSIRYALLGGFKYYFANPLAISGNVNPDGKIGSPVLTILGGNSFSSSSDSKGSLNLDFALSFPLSSRITLSGSYRYFEEIEPFEVSQAGFEATYYLADYAADSAYVNPDGPVGYPAFNLAMGGSENGYFGEIAIILPILNTLTLTSLLRMERTDDPYQLSLAAGFGLAIYPHRQ